MKIFKLIIAFSIISCNSNNEKTKADIINKKEENKKVEVKNNKKVERKNEVDLKEEDCFKSITSKTLNQFFSSKDCKDIVNTFKIDSSFLQSFTIDDPLKSISVINFLSETKDSSDYRPLYEFGKGSIVKINENVFGVQILMDVSEGQYVDGQNKKIFLVFFNSEGDVLDWKEIAMIKNTYDSFFLKESSYKNGHLSLNIIKRTFDSNNNIEVKKSEENFTIINGEFNPN